MPKIPTPSSAKTRMPLDRLRLLDSFFASNRRYLNREELLHAVNRRLDRHISISSLDKDIKALKEHLQHHPKAVKLVWDRDGYRYDSNGRFSVFDDYIDERDVLNVRLAIEFIVSNYPELRSEMVETAVRLTSGCPSVDVKEVFEDKTHMHQRPANGRKECGITNSLMKCCRLRKAQRAVVFLPSGKTVELNISPLGLVPKAGEIWLACAVHSERGGHSLKVIPVRQFEDMFHTDARYRPIDEYRRLLDQDFDSHILRHVKRREDHRSTIH